MNLKICSFLVCALTAVGVLTPTSELSAQSLTTETVQHTPIPQPVPPYGPAPQMFPPFVESDMWLFQPGEMYIDVFGIGATHQGNDFGDTLGAGAAFGYWYNRYFGVLVEAYAADLPQGHDATLLGGIQLRLPVDDAAFAFYIFASGGGFFADKNGATFQGGIGVDVRLTETTSLIFDVRAINVWGQNLNLPVGRETKIAKEADGAILYRLGLRFVF
jgi:hypothetical protein